MSACLAPGTLRHADHPRENTKSVYRDVTPPSLPGRLINRKFYSFSTSHAYFMYRLIVFPSETNYSKPRDFDTCEKMPQCSFESIEIGQSLFNSKSVLAPSFKKPKPLHNKKDNRLITLKCAFAPSSKKNQNHYTIAMRKILYVAARNYFKHMKHSICAKWYDSYQYRIFLILNPLNTLVWMYECGFFDLKSYWTAKFNNWITVTVKIISITKTYKYW